MAQADCQRADPVGREWPQAVIGWIEIPQCRRPPAPPGVCYRLGEVGRGLAGASIQNVSSGLLISQEPLTLTVTSSHMRQVYGCWIVMKARVASRTCVTQGHP